MLVRAVEPRPTATALPAASTATCGPSAFCPRAERSNAEVHYTASRFGPRLDDVVEAVEAAPTATASRRSRRRPLVRFALRPAAEISVAVPQPPPGGRTTPWMIVCEPLERDQTANAVPAESTATCGRSRCARQPRYPLPSPSTARRPDDALNGSCASIGAGPDGQRGAGGVDGDLRFGRILSWSREVSRRKPGWRRQCRRGKSHATRQRSALPHAARLVLTPPRHLTCRCGSASRTVRAQSSNFISAKAKGNEAFFRSLGA
jgi:hypothetical protein